MLRWPDGGTPKLVFQVKLYSEGLLNTKSPEVANLLYIQVCVSVQIIRPNTPLWRLPLMLQCVLVMFVHLSILIEHRLLQAVYHVILGMYQLPQEDAIRAGALQVFVKFGAHDASKYRQHTTQSPSITTRCPGPHKLLTYGPLPSCLIGRHKPGFLSKTLLEYIPGTIIRSKPPEEWETEIFAVHEKLTCTDKNEARQQYLDLCGKLDYYGCSLFAVRVRDKAAAL